MLVVAVTWWAGASMGGILKLGTDWRVWLERSEWLVSCGGWVWVITGLER